MLQSLLKRKNLRKLKSSFILLLFLPTITLAQDASIMRTKSNVWVAQCKSCHASHDKLGAQVGIRTEQYLFNYVYQHKNAEGKKFGDILPGDEIEFVARFVLVSAYLHKLESDMRKAGDHLQKNIKL
jgi:hypothetical protein